MKDRKEKNGDEASLRVTRKTGKLIVMLATWSDQTVAEFFTESLDPILEEKFKMMVETGANIPKRKRE